MKVLIIGGTGNISTPIVDYLLEKGADVTLYNRGKSRKKLPEGVKLITGDRTNFAEFEARMKGAGEFDCVIDMILFTAEEAESAVRAFAGRVGHFIFCSTVDVFTKPAQLYPITEQHERNPNPAFEYAFEKAKAEKILEAAHRQGDLPLTILRPAATYNDSWCPISLIGPGPAFLRRIREGKPVIVLGDGQSIWVSCHRNDVARAFVNAAYNRDTIGKSYNIPGEEFITWEIYYQTVQRVMQAPPLQLVRVPAVLLSKMDPKSASWCAWNFQFNNLIDNTAARADLDFRYTITWEEGVRRMVAHHDAANSINTAEPCSDYDRIVTAWQKMEAEMVGKFSE